MSALRLFRRLMTSASAPVAERPEPAFPAIAPDEPLCLVGDVHGRADLLERFLHLRARHFPDHRAVFLGDAIDRGPDSAGVLRILMAEVAAGAICLMGNHEEMALAFLDAPEGDNGRRWLAHGGLEMLGSYGLRGLPQTPDDRRAARDALRRAMEPGAEEWLRALPHLWQSGNLVAVHAGLDPALPLERQTARTMLWGDPDATRRMRDDGLWVAHGHVIVDRARVRRGRIALDTGAYATGMLSYALVDPRVPESERITLAVVP